MRLVLIELSGAAYPRSEHDVCEGCELLIQNQNIHPGQYARCPLYGELYAHTIHDGLVERPAECIETEKRAKVLFRGSKR